MKRQLFFAVLLFSSIFLPFEAAQLTETTNTKEYVIGVDLHDTFLSRDTFAFTKSILGIFVKAPNKWQLLSLIPRFIFILRDAYTIGQEPEASGSGRYVLEKLTAKYPALKTIVDDIVYEAQVNLHKPNPAMIKLIEELKAKGYPVIAVSNINQEGLDGIRAQYPEAFSLFDDFFISDAPRSVEIKGEEILIPKKPAIDYYKILRTKLLDTTDRYKNKPMIFIDDRKDFIEGAQQADVNIEGILFETPEQLKKELINRNILQPKGEKQAEAPAVT